MSNKPIIISLIVFLLISFGYLAYTETKQQSPNSQNWWVIYFSNPKDGSLDFAIENNSDKAKFHYAISADEEILKESDVEISKGTKKEIALPKSDFENVDNKKVTITVTSDTEKKEIYKIL